MDPGGVKMIKTQLENDVTEYYRSVYRSVINVEKDTLLKVLDDEFTFEGLSGDVSDRDKFLSDLEDESVNVFSENCERIYVKKDGDILNVRGRSKVNISLNGEKRRIKKIQVDIVLRKAEEGKDPDTGELRPELTRWCVMSAKAALY